MFVVKWQDICNLLAGRRWSWLI